MSNKSSDFIKKSSKIKSPVEIKSDEINLLIEKESFNKSQIIVRNLSNDGFNYFEKICNKYDKCKIFTILKYEHYDNLCRLFQINPDNKISLNNFKTYYDFGAHTFANFSIVCRSNKTDIVCISPQSEIIPINRFCPSQLTYMRIYHRSFSDFNFNPDPQQITSDYLMNLYKQIEIICKKIYASNVNNESKSNKIDPYVDKKKLQEFSETSNLDINIKSELIQYFIKNFKYLLDVFYNTKNTFSKVETSIQMMLYVNKFFDEFVVIYPHFAITTYNKITEFNNAITNSLCELQNKNNYNYKTKNNLLLKLQSVILMIKYKFINEMIKNEQFKNAMTFEITDILETYPFISWIENIISSENIPDKNIFD